MRRSHPQCVPFNDHLERLLGDVQTAALDLKADKRAVLSASAMKRELRGPGARDFFSYAESYVQNLDDEGRLWEWKKVRVLLEKLRDFTKNEGLTFDEIDYGFVIRFERYMREKRKNHTNTIRKSLQILQRIIKKAVRDGLMSANDNPFLHYTIKSEKTSKEKLTIEEIQALEKLQLKEGSALWHTRNYFLFSFYCAGIRFGDLCRLPWGHISKGRLEYRMAKTGTLKSIKLMPQAQAILAHYMKRGKRKDHFIFPLLDDEKDYSDPRYVRRQISSRNAVVNNNLKKLAEKAGVQAPLSFHISRHSFTDYARTAGLDLYSISKALGHSDIKITETYLKSFDHEAVDNAMERLFNSTGNPPSG